MADYARRRMEKQPLDMPSAGSTFKRPEGAYAGALIDQCGLRGYAIGGAQVSQKHCGFIVNTGNATCADVLCLADTVCKIVTDETGFRLEKEVRVVKYKWGKGTYEPIDRDRAFGRGQIAGNARAGGHRLFLHR